MEQVELVESNKTENDSSDSDVSSTYHSDGEIYTSIFHSEIYDTSEDSNDFPLELYETERRQLEDFNFTIKVPAQTIGSQESKFKLPVLEQVLSGENFFIYTRPSIHRAIAECKGLRVPEGLSFVSCVFSETRPVYLLGTVSNTRDPNDGDREYIASIARAITKKVRCQVVSNFDVVCGIVREDECDDEQKLEDKLREFTKATQQRTFDRSLEMYRDRCIAVVQCFLAMIGIVATQTKDETVTELDENNQPEDISPVFREFLRHPASLWFRNPAIRQDSETRSLGTNSDTSRASLSNSEVVSSPTMTDDDKLHAERSLGSENVQRGEPIGKEVILTSFRWGPKKEPKWTKLDAERLRQYVLQTQKDSEGNPACLKLLMFGPTGHGKSSFCNGCRSAIKGDDQPSTYYSVATRDGTLTHGFHGAPYGDHWIIDMPGIFESNRINSVNIENIASGKVPFYAEITDTLEVKDQGSIPPPAPGENDVSCVIIVLKYDTELGPELSRQIKVITGLGGKGVISYHLVLTHLDECDPQFNDTDNLPNLYQSPRVQAAVKRMSEETGIPPFAISFVKNYTRETETDLNSTLQHLRVLERVIKTALDQVEKRIDKKRHRALYSKPKKVQKVIEFDLPSQQDEKSGTSEGIDFDKKRWSVDSQKGNEVRDRIHLTVNDVKFVIVVLLIAVLVIYIKI